MRHGLRPQHRRGNRSGNRSGSRQADRQTEQKQKGYLDGAPAVPMERFVRACGAGRALSMHKSMPPKSERSLPGSHPRLRVRQEGSIESGDLREVEKADDGVVVIWRSRDHTSARAVRARMSSQDLEEGLHCRHRHRPTCRQEAKGRERIGQHSTAT